jgi:hypothetical protein
MTDTTGLSTENAYASFGELVAATTPTGAGGENMVTTFAYDQAGRMTFTTRRQLPSRRRLLRTGPW